MVGATLAARVAEALGACVLDSDGFFAGGVTVRSDAPQDRARDCIDWKRQRPVLEALRAGREAGYAAFDWDAFDGRVAVCLFRSGRGATVSPGRLWRDLEVAHLSRQSTNVGGWFCL
jgi:hypothetical protein